MNIGDILNDFKNYKTGGESINKAQNNKPTIVNKPQNNKPAIINKPQNGYIQLKLSKRENIKSPQVYDSLPTINDRPHQTARDNIKFDDIKDDLIKAVHENKRKAREEEKMLNLMRVPLRGAPYGAASAGRKN